MRTIVFSAFIFFLALASCSYFQKDENPCEHLMHKEKLIEVMTEMYIIESYLETLPIKEEQKLDSVSLYYNTFFHRHNVTKDEITEALNCYVIHKNVITEVHDEIINTISILESRESEIKEKEED